MAREGKVDMMVVKEEKTTEKAGKKRTVLVAKAMSTRAKRNQKVTGDKNKEKETHAIIIRLSDPVVECRNI